MLGKFRSALVLFTSLPAVGGHATTTLSLVQLLRPWFAEIIVIAKEMPGHGFSAEAAEALRALGAEVMVLPAGGRAGAAALAGLFLKIPLRRLRAGRPAVFLAIGMRHLSPVLARLLRARRSVYYHITHELDRERTGMLKQYCRRFDTLAFISPATARAWRAQQQDSGEGGKGEYPYLLQPSELEGVPPPAPRTDGGPVRFGFVGRLNAAKGCGVLAAFARSAAPLCELHLAGSGEFGEEFQALEQAAPRAEGVRVRCHGRFSPTPAARAAFLREFFAGADFLTVPSQDEREGIPTVILEALQHGVPVLATDCGGTRAFGTADLLQDFPPAVRLIPVADFPAALAEQARTGPPSAALRESCRELHRRLFSDAAILDSWKSVLGVK